MIVRAAIAPMHAEARVSSPQVSQRLAGHAVTVLETDSDWYRVRGEDGYEGWMHRGYLDQATDGTASRLLSLGCVVRTPSNTMALPLGAWVPDDGIVISGEAIDAQSRSFAFPREPAAIAETAVERFDGTPYQWGGVSPWGADCSGLVQTTFWLHGVSLPRDAWQQAETGESAGAELSAWRASDLLFFSDRTDKRITHVGISLGQSRMVHLALWRGGYAVERLDDESDAYVSSLMSRFVCARRLSS
jgi:gamma-D-glutamyl-L-lysine dipeptidyl-peptidase